MDDQIQIYYPQGKMEVILSEFFPCKVKEAQIIFPLINLYGEGTEKEKLRTYLISYAQVKKDMLNEMEADYQSGRRRPGRNYGHTQTLYKRALRNLQYLEG